MFRLRRNCLASADAHNVTKEIEKFVAFIICNLIEPVRSGELERKTIK